ncbi:MAG: 3,4-dihydroxy-2-butanone-4-phosphate synthase [Thermoplasmataceae archaeon]
MIEKAISSLRAGKPVLIFDSKDREGETDIVFPSQTVTDDSIRFMRKSGGGLICTTMKEDAARELGLPYIEDFYKKYLNLDQKVFDHSDLKYDRNSSFSVTINHRDTFTGIPDRDRALTIGRFAKFLSELPGLNGNAGKRFSLEFRIPGHVILLIAREGYFQSRRGHTELSTYLVEKAGFVPSATIVEMLGDDGYSLPEDKAREFAEKHYLTFIEGDDIIASWLDDQGNGYGSLRHSPSRAHTLSS